MAMMFALLQEHHKSQMEAMAAANQKAMDLMMEKMNAIIAGQTKPADKENTLPAISNAGGGTVGTKWTKKKCPHCGKNVFHRPLACFECEANAGKQWVGWKSMKDTSKTSI